MVLLILPLDYKLLRPQILFSMSETGSNKVQGIKKASQVEALRREVKGK